MLRAGDLPLHRQLFLVLRSQIQSGAIEPDQALPTEFELCQLYGVSRMTVRRALQDLAELGFVERLQGRGTFARDPSPAMVPAPGITFLDGLRHAHHQTTVAVIDVADRIAPARITGALDLPPRTPARYALRVRSRDDVPLMLSETWLPIRFRDVVTAENLERRALFEILGESGITLGRVVQEITATSADPRAAQLLQTNIGSPLLQLNRLIHDDGGQPIQYHTIYLSPGSSRITMDIPADGIDTISSGQVVHDVGKRGSPGS
jgi:GntR family transcriptional regulator